MEHQKRHGDQRNLATAVRGFGTNIVATYQKPVVACRKCNAAIDATAHVSFAAPHQGILCMDTRQTIVRCPKCKGFSRVYVYPLFNWIPPARALAEAVALNVLSLALMVFVTCS